MVALQRGSASTAWDAELDLRTRKWKRRIFSLMSNGRISNDQVTEEIFLWSS
jgi:hypothetical protein